MLWVARQSTGPDGAFGTYSVVARTALVMALYRLPRDVAATS